MRFRVMVWNVKGFRAGTRVVAEAVAAEGPDLLLLNETGRLGFRLARFARRARLAWDHGWLRRVPNAVLARPPWRLLRSELVQLPRTGRTVRRGVILSQVGRAGSRLWAGSIHLGLSGQERTAHARVLTDVLVARERLLLGGDLNEEPDAPAASWIGERYWDAFGGKGRGEGFTFPSNEPRARIDYLFVSEGIDVEGIRVGERRLASASDHLPLIADLSVG